METVNVTLNPKDKALALELSNGNLTVTNLGAGAIRATHGKTSGKWYWEIRFDSGDNIVTCLGIANLKFSVTNPDSLSNDWRAYYTSTGVKFPDNAPYSTGWKIGDVIGVALDLDNYTLEFYKNGVSMGISHTDLGNLGKVYPILALYNNIPKTITINFGLNPFFYTIPSGFQAYNIHPIERFLVANQNLFFKYQSESWHIITQATPTIDDFLNGNIFEEVNNIPESAWSELTGEIQLYHYTTDSNQSESNITVEIEPFTLYEELDDTANVSYHTGKFDWNNVELRILADYSPLDEIDGDFEVVTWLSNDDTQDLHLDMVALPKPRLIMPLKDLNISGELQKLFLSTAIEEDSVYGRIKVVISSNGGSNWYTYRYNTWKEIDITDLERVRRHGMTSTEVGNLDTKTLTEFSPNNRIRIAYYIEQGEIDEIVVIKSLSAVQEIITRTPELHSLTIIYDQLDERYSGLMFMDTDQQYYSTSIGEVLKYLDMGTLIAGQTSIDIRVLLTNTNPFDVKNITLSTDHNIDGVNIELSKTTNPFITESRLEFDQELKFDEVIEFYVRLSVNRNAESGGSFDIEVQAEPA